MRGASDSEQRPGALPHPWSRLEWRPLAPARNRTKSRLYWAVDGTRPVVCKDASALSPILPMGLFRRYLLRREAHILQRLAGVAGVPGLIARWRSGLIMEFVPGKMLADWPRDGVPAAAFDRLDRLVEAIHARGISITDLHRRNVLVGDDGEVHLVDFEIAFDAHSGLGRLVARRFMRLDRFACARQRQRFGIALDPTRRAIIDRPPFGYEALSRFKLFLRSLVGRSTHPRGASRAAAAASPSDEDDE